MLFSRRSATSACAVALIVMAVTPYHRFSSSIGLASGAMTWLVILGACLAAFGHGVALRKGREIRRPKHLGAIGVFLGVIATVPEWADLAFYARGDSIPFVFAPIWLLRGVSCASCFTGSLLLSYVIWNTAGSPLIRGAARDGERGTRRPQSALFAETVVVLSCLLFCCRVSWRVVPEPWGMPSVTAASIGIVLLIPLVYLVLAAVPLLCCLRAFGRGQSDVFARSVLVAVPIGLVPAVEAAYFASDAAIIVLLAMGSAIAVAFVCTLLRGGGTGQQSGYCLRVRPIRCGSVFPCPVASRRAVCSTAAQRENAGGNCQGDGYEAIDGANNASPSIREGVGCGLTRARGVVCR